MRPRPKSASLAVTKATLDGGVGGWRSRMNRAISATSGAVTSRLANRKSQTIGLPLHSGIDQKAAAPSLASFSARAPEQVAITMPVSASIRKENDIGPSGQRLAAARAEFSASISLGLSPHSS